MEYNGLQVSIIVALGRSTRAIGKGNGLLWHIPDDLKRFKRLTLGHSVIMGRKTFESIREILGKALPDRPNIVITRQEAYDGGEGVHVVHSLDEGFQKAREFERGEVFVIGGEDIYTQALPYADRLYLTLVDSDLEGDTWFPRYDEFSNEIERENRTHDGLPYTWLTLERK